MVGTRQRKNYVRFLLFISFFPQLIQGPINRYGEMAPQLTARHIWNWERTKRALFLFLFGAMKKYAIANLTAPTIAAILDGNDPKLAGSMALLAILLYSLQQYADFSGGIDMVLGVAQLYGIEMMPNFRQPYFSTSLGDFWRRWHITLSGWFRDYIYIPLGGNRKGQARQLLNMFLVWAATGIWHGASWNFIAWGLYYFVLLTIEKTFLLKYLKKGKVWPHIYTLFFVVLGWASLRPTSPAHRWVCCCKSCLCPRAAFRPCTTCAITVCCWCWAVSARPRCRTGCGRKSAKILWQSSLCLPC